MSDDPVSQQPDSLSDLFNVHAALVSAEAARPHLKDNPHWKILRMDAYEAFHRAMGDA